MPGMLDQELIKTKIDLIQRDLERLEELRGYTLDEIAGDFYKWSALKLTLVEIIGRAVDINSHIIAELQEKEAAPGTLRETFLRLADLNILPRDFAEKIAESARFRNKIVHEYNHLEEDKVYYSVDEALAQYAKYCGYVLEFIEQNNTESA